MLKILLLRVVSDNKGDDMIAEAIKQGFRQSMVKISFTEISVKEKVGCNAVNYINTFDAVILGGSGLFVNHKFDSGFYFNCRPEFFDRIKIPLYIIGVGSNDNFKYSSYGKLKERTIANIKKLIGRAKFTWVRDNQTKNLLLSNGISDVVYIPCPVLAMGSLFGSSVDTDSPMSVSISFGKHGKYVSSVHDYLVVCYAKILRRVLNEFDININFIAHRDIDYDSYNDLVNRKEFRDDKEKFKFTLTNSPYIMNKLYSESMCHIGVYLHSNIIAFSNGCPVNILGYDKKCKAFYEDIVKDNELCTYNLLHNINISMIYRAVISSLHRCRGSLYAIKEQDKIIQTLSGIARKIYLS